MPALAEYKVAPDWIGFGFSAKPERRNLLTPDAFVTALLSLFSRLKSNDFLWLSKDF